MILIRRYKNLFKTTITCTIPHNIRDIQFCVPYLCNGYAILSCELKIFKHLKNIQTLSYSSNVKGMQIKSKEQLLYRGINNCNVNLRMVESLIEDLENNVYNISPILSLKLLNCCGNVLYNEPLKVRQELTNRVWNLLKDKNCNLSIDHYHALLQTYIDNDYRIDPTQFLNNMTIKPEYQTYCLLLQVLPNSNDCAIPELLIADINKNDEKIYNALIYAYAINGNTEKVRDVIKVMKEQNIEPSITTYMHLMYAFAKNNDIEALIENLMIHKPSTSQIMKLIKFLSLMKNGTHGDRFAATFLKKLLNLPECDINTVITILTAMKRYNVLISPADVEDIKDQISYSNLNEKHSILQLISSVTARNIDNYNTGTCVHPKYMNLEQLYSHLDELRSKGKNTREILRKIFIDVCKHNYTEKINEIRQEFNSKNLEWSPGMKTMLFYYYVKNEMIDEASSLLYEIKFLFPDFKIHNFKIIHFATLLVEHNKIDEAFNIVENSLINQEPITYKAIDDLLNLLVTKENSKNSVKMLDLLIKRGYVTNYHHIIIYTQHLIRGYILKGDIISALDIFIKCVERYKRTPAKHELLIELLKSTSNGFLNKFLLIVYNLIVRVHGKHQADVNLAIAFCICDYKKQLQNLLERNSISGITLLRQLQYLKDDDVITVTLKMLENVKNVEEINLKPICNYTLTVCDKRNDYGLVLALEKKMKEKGIEFSKDFEKTLTKYDK